MDIRCRYSFGVSKRGEASLYLISSPFPLARGRGIKGDRVRKSLLARKLHLLRVGSKLEVKDETDTGSRG
jgi:hypothetical protein